jgi:hypothetical protein
MNLPKKDFRERSDQMSAKILPDGKISVEALFMDAGRTPA